MQPKSFKKSWMNSILHLTSFIAQKKEAIETLHGIPSFVAVIVLILAEILLLVISFPVYVAVRPSSLADEKGVHAYKRRRIISLSLILSLFIVWLIKLILIIVLSYSGSGITREEVSLTHPDTETKIVEMLINDTDSKLIPPVINSVNETYRAITVSGTAPKNTTVVVAFSDETNPSVPPKFYSALTDKDGNFTIQEDRNIFYLSEGVYNVTALTLDQKHKTKSAESRGFSVTVDRPLIEDFALNFDRILNILALLFIGVGFVTLVLTA